jgi:ATPase family protein associated with various cellular activities (AAA)
MTGVLEGEGGELSLRQVVLDQTAAEEVLPERELAVLRDAIAKAKLDTSYGHVAATPSSGSGATIVFSGEGGPAKLLAAKALARETGQPLYRVGAAQVVSKYIGETEKNLERVFQQVPDSGAILLFDEADSLFGKRSEVKDSHDRYAILSPDAFLKARAAFSGTVILDADSQPTANEGGPSRLGYEVRFPLSGEV